MSREQNDKLRPFPYRQLFWKWHLYAGWFGGPLIVFIAVTGAILAFAPEIDRALRPDLWSLSSSPGAASIETPADQPLIDCVRGQYPGCSIIRYSQNFRADEPYYFMVATAGGEILDVWVNPYTRSIVGARIWKNSFVRIVEQLHRRLLADVPGSIVMELITGWIIVLTLTGLFLWFPKSWKALRHGLIFSFQGSVYKTNWRLHNTLGAWTAVVILALSLTGMLFSYYTGEMYENLVRRTSVKKAAAPSPSASPGGTTPKTIDQLLVKVRQDLPSHRPLEVWLPRKEGGKVTISATAETRPTWDDISSFQKWTFDPATGELLDHETWADLHPLVKFWELSETVHFGSVFGLPTKLIALVSCLAVPILSVTGYLIWWWKRQGRLKAAARQTPVRASTPVHVMPVSKGLIACLIVVGIVFPTIGASFLVLLAWEFTLWTLSKWNSKLA